MGSLMPGWSTQPDAKRELKRSMTSLTKEEIEAYWRHKQREEEAHSKEANDQNASPGALQMRTSATVATAQGEQTHVVIEWQQPTASSRDWWTRSDWAYLNAPPEIDLSNLPSRHRYASQFGVSARANKLRDSLSSSQLNLFPSVF